jgi:hypothetical protein
MTKFGCSSGIQWPNNDPVIPLTFESNSCVEFNAKLSWRSPPTARYISPPTQVQV